ncbi:Serine/threonine-protein kinase PrkC [Phycisphaerales bacterium]|nr:Serine/threonine-protein kinase PrkC [Phycisphaerales bacterium]
MADTQTVTLTRDPTRTTVGAGDVPTVTGVTIPKNLGPVQLVKELGKGGMGVVWLGRHTMLNQDVAVKFLLNLVTSNDDPHFAMFLEGARAAAALRHKGLNPVLNADVVEGVPFIIMEYVEGPTLANLLHKVSPFPLAATRLVMEAACDAVAELHENNVIHRDIKPANILLAADGTPVLTDFGLACTRQVVLTGAKVEGVAGTPDYMAPEMFDRTVSPRSDVYALGIMFYEMLTGNTPFEGDYEQIRAAHREVEIPLGPVKSIHAALADVVERATTKNPMFRIKSARHLQIAIQDAFSQIDPMLANFAKGEAELVGIVQRWSKGGKDDSPISPTPEVGGTYYDRLSTIAAKRKSGDAAAVGDPAPAQIGERAPAGTRCARCSADISQEIATGRCPSCLLLVRYSLNPADYEQVKKSGIRAEVAAAAVEPVLAKPTPPAPTAPARPEPARGLLARIKRLLGG